MAYKKKQHYVPRFYLSHFCENNSITCLQIKNGEIVSRIPYVDQCQKDYYYGKDGSEEALEIVEARFSTVLRQLNEGAILDDEKNAYLRQFIMLQMIRTPSWVNNFNNMLINLTGEKDIVSCSVRPEHLLRGVEHWQDINDLALAIVTTQADCLVLTSDNPIVRYNPLFPNSKIINHTGTSESGLVIICPISSKKVAILYDASVYVPGSITTTDIVRINKLVIMNADITVYAHPDFPIEALEYLYDLAIKKNAPRAELPSIRFKAKGRWIFITQEPNLDFSERFDFLRIKIDPKLFSLHRHYCREKQK